MAEQRYKAVQAVTAEGKTVTEVAGEWRVSRQTLHTLLARYEAGGLEDLGDRSHRPARCPHQMSGELEAMVSAGVAQPPETRMFSAPAPGPYRAFTCGLR